MCSMIWPWSNHTCTYKYVLVVIIFFVNKCKFNVINIIRCISCDKCDFHNFVLVVVRSSSIWIGKIINLLKVRKSVALVQNVFFNAWHLNWNIYGLPISPPISCTYRLLIDYVIFRKMYTICLFTLNTIELYYIHIVLYIVAVYMYYAYFKQC